MNHMELYGSWSKCVAHSPYKDLRSTPIYIYTYTYTYICIYIYIYMYTYVYIYIYAYILLAPTSWNLLNNIKFSGWASFFLLYSFWIAPFYFYYSVMLLAMKNTPTFFFLRPGHFLVMVFNCVCMYVGMHAWMHVCMDGWMDVCMYVYVYVCICMCMYVYVWVCMCMYVYVCVCICMYV